MHLNRGNRVQRVMSEVGLCGFGPRARAACGAIRLAAWVIAAVVGFGETVLAAPRLEIVPMVKGERLEGSQTCFSRSRNTGGVLDAMISGPEIKCLSTDQILSMPRGVWHVYIAHESRQLVSTHPFKMVLSIGSDDNAELKRLMAEMSHAASLDVREVNSSISPGRALNIYVAHPNGPPAIVPVSSDDASILMPVNVPLRALEVEGARITRVGKEVLLGPDSTLSASWDDSPYLLVPITVGDLVLTGLDLPTINLVDRAREEVAHRVKLSRESMGIFFVPTRSLRPGTYDVQTQGDAWTATGASVKIENAKLVVTEDVKLAPASESVKVAWTFDAQAFSGPEECDGPDEPLAADIRLLRCPEELERLDHSTSTRCSVLEHRVVNEASGEIAWPIPAGGSIWSDLRIRNATIASRMTPARGEQVIDLRLTPRQLRGFVRSGDEALQAMITCGPSFAVTKEGGAFLCPLRDNQTFPMALRIVPCDGSQEFAYVVERGDDADRSLEIVAPTNLLDVTVRDATGRAIEGANVYFFMGDAEGELGPTRTLGQTSTDGVVSGVRLPHDVALTLCAGKKDFLRECLKQRALSATEERRLQITLNAEESQSGRVVDDLPIVNGSLFVSNDGQVLARVGVAPDGTFRLPAGTLLPNATLVLVSRSHPLTTLARDNQNPLRLRIPAPSEIRDIVVTSSRTGPVTVVLNGVIVPLDAMLQHQSLRRLEYWVQAGQPLIIPRVNIHGAVVVVLGSPSDPLSLSSSSRIAERPQLMLGKDASVNF